MRKINNDISLFKAKVNNQSINKPVKSITRRDMTIEQEKTTRASRITFALNANLCQQAENWLNSRRTQNDYTYSSLSELIRKSLEAYQEKKVEINPIERDKFSPKREITIRFFNSDLLNFYYSLPKGQRTAIIEESLQSYLEKMSTEKN